MVEPQTAITELIREDTGGGWLVTYADLMTLLLTFFVLLFSISSMNLEKFRAALAAIQVSLGENHPPVRLIEMIDEDPSTIMVTKTKKKEDETVSEEPEGKKIVLENLIGLKSREIFRGVQKFIRKSGLSDHIMVTMQGSKVVIRVTGQVLFESGAAILNPISIPILSDIFDIAQQHPEYVIRIEGHSDDIPISTPQFPSNWELSAVRATTVLRFLIDKGIDPHRLTATGYGSLLPLVPNTTETNRARNRRVEFVLEKQENP